MITRELQSGRHNESTKTQPEIEEKSKERTESINEFVFPHAYFTIIEQRTRQNKKGCELPSYTCLQFDWERNRLSVRRSESAKS